MTRPVMKVAAMIRSAVTTRRACRDRGDDRGNCGQVVADHDRVGGLRIDVYAS